MKKKNLMLLFISALLMGFTFASCGGDDDGAPEKPKTEEPGGGGGNEGEDPDPENPDTGDINDPSGSLSGSDYFVIQLDETCASKIKNKVVAEFYPDGVDGETPEEAAEKIHLYVWDNTYEAGTPSGPNCYGLVHGWTSLVVTSVGWSGAGYSVPAYRKDDLLKMQRIANEPEKYFLHISVKTKQTGKSHLLLLNYGTGNTGKVAIGSVPFMDGGATFEPYADITTDGEWNELNIPITEFMKPEAGGLDYLNKSDIETAGTNVLSFLSGGVAGTTFDFDAVFIYKKK